MPEATLDSLVSNPLEEILGKEQFYALREEALKKYSNLITKIDEKTKSAFNLDETVNAFKKNIEEKTKKIKESKTSDILPQTTEQEKDGVEKKENKNNLLSGLKDTLAGAVLPKEIENVKPKEVGEEQKTLGPKAQLIEFSDKTQTFLKDLFKNIGMDPKMEEEMKKYFKDSIENQNAMLENTKESGFLGMIGKLLAIAGIGSILVAAFWDKIKPWIEEKLGTKLDFLDKFEGLIEGIGKFFTMGGLKITFGPLLSIVGNTLKSFGELVEKGLTWVFKGLLGGAGDDLAKGGAEAAAKSGIFKNFLPKLAGGLFKGVGTVALKGIPVIGSLISFYFAYDRFQKSDYIGAIIDLVGGLANLLSFTPLAPLALPISLGAAALNAFLDYKADGAEGAEGQASKKLALSGIFTGLGNMLMKVPFIASLVNGITGTWDFITGIISGDLATLQIGINGMKNIPIFAPIASFFENILAAGTPVNATTGAKFSGTTFMENIKKKVGKKILGWFSWLPSWLYNDIADFMGIPLDGSGNIVEEEPNLTPTGKTPQQLAKEKYVDPLTKSKPLEASVTVNGKKMTLDEYEKWTAENNLNKNISKKDEQQPNTSTLPNKEVKDVESQNEELDLNTLLTADPLEMFGQQLLKINEKSKGLNIEPSSKEIPKFIDDKVDTQYEPVNPDISPKTTDQDLVVRETRDSTNVLVKAVESLINVLKENQKTPIPITVNTSGSQQSSSSDYLFKTQPLDPNELSRMSWWNISKDLRATV